jgi:hypothetical protein
MFHFTLSHTRMRALTHSVMRRADVYILARRRNGQLIFRSIDTDVSGQKGIGTALGVLGRLFIVNHVMPEVIDRLLHRRSERVKVTRIDDNFNVWLALNFLTQRCRRPVVLLPDHDESRNRWIDFIPTVGVVGDESRNLCIMTCWKSSVDRKEGGNGPL